MAESTAFPSAIPKQSKRRPESYLAEAKFRDRVEELGGTVVEPTWKGTGAKHEIRCQKGHTSYPYPNRVGQGVGICRACAGLDPLVAEKKFLTRLVEEGIEVLIPYSGAKKLVSLKCSAGHRFTGTPTKIVLIKGLVCQFCQGSDPASMLARLCAVVEDQDGELLESEWLGAVRGHLVRCGEGHLRRVVPNKLFGGRSLCAECKGYTPEALASQYAGIVEELGGTALDEYHGATKTHRVRCPKGHIATPTPHSLLGGGGLCRFCAGKGWDVFYVVQDDMNDVVKFGITSGNPRPRLGNHARDGFDQVVRLHTGLADDVAPELERMVLAALRDAREVPVRGREYFDSSALALILDLVDNHPALRLGR